MKTTTYLFVMLLAVFSMPAMAGDAENGRKLAETCLGCHAGATTNASPNYHVPKLGGQHADYIVAALQGYKSGQRYHPTMKANAAQLSDQDMADIAAFISSVK